MRKLADSCWERIFRSGNLFLFETFNDEYASAFSYHRLLSIIIDYYHHQIITNFATEVKRGAYLWLNFKIGYSYLICHW